MGDISPAVMQEIVCAETPAPPVALIVFGASGDLVSRKLLPCIFELLRRDLLNPNFYLAGCARTEMSDEQFRGKISKSIHGDLENVPQEILNKFIEHSFYISGDYKDASFYKNISEKINQLDRIYNVDGGHIFYLAVPPALYEIIAENLSKAGLSGKDKPDCQKIRLIIEKPFGRDLQSATELNFVLQKHFRESQIYRIDHYLGKETVQNIQILRFANTIFEPVWNRNFIDHVQITIAESGGIENRGSYYDKAGALRDIFQNHLLEILSLVAMEPPASFEADHIRDEKVKLLRCIRPVDTQNIENDFVRGQYTSAIINGKKVPGYLDEKDVVPGSTTETYVAAKIFIDNWRWQDVPFYLRTGKNLARKDTEIAITFKKVPHSMFASFGLTDLPANTLVIQIQPEEGISLSFQAKRPGSKVCIGTLRMKFSYAEVFGGQPPEAYERLLLDCMQADQTLFAREDSIEVSWRLLAPVLEKWENQQAELYKYPAGAGSFLQADKLIEKDGRKWRSLSE